MLAGADDDIRIPLDPHGVGQDLQRRPVQRDRVGSRRRTREADAVALDMLPLQGLDLGQPRPV